MRMHSTVEGPSESFFYLFQSGWTALHLAARAGHLRMVQLLLDSGASARSRNCHGRVPLWYAASEGQQDVLALLLTKEHDAYSLMDDRRVIQFPLQSSML